MPVQFKGKIDATSDDRLTKTKILHHKSLENNNKTEKIPITKDENISKELLEFNADDTTSKEEKTENQTLQSYKQNSEPEKNANEVPTEMKQEEEEEEDISGMRTMRKETENKFADMEAEFEAGRSKLAALRARIRRARENAKVSSDVDTTSES